MRNRCKIFGDNQSILFLDPMGELVSSHYYSELRQSVDHLFDLELQVIPAMSCSIDHDEYTGLERLRYCRHTGCDAIEEIDSFGLEGTEICGSWSNDGLTFNGFFPAAIWPDGKYVLTTKHLKRSPEEIYHQIDLAEEFGFLLGVAVDTWNPGFVANEKREEVNAVIYSDVDILRQLAGADNIRIESNGEYCWAYSFFDFRSIDSRSSLSESFSRYFGLIGSNSPVGLIEAGGIVPAYPSYIQGRQIKLIEPGDSKSKFTLQSTQLARIHFDVEVLESVANSHCEDPASQVSEPDINALPLLESLEWCHTPDEDEALFQQSLIDFESLLRIPAQICTPPPATGEEVIPPDTECETDINLYSFVPHKLASSLSLVKENLPYDSLCVLVSFLTGVASMLRLGTSVTGNELTDYTVPINLYTILVARSGRKKSPLQNLFVVQPASDVMLSIAKENERIMKHWRDENRGKKASERTMQPISIDIRVNDYTGEAFVQALGKLDEVGRSVLVMREEIAALFESLNAYKSGKGSDEQQLLELYDGRGFRSLRVGDKGRAFSRAAVNIYGTIQPEVLDSLLKNGDSSGLWARFCFAAMPDMTKQLPTQSDPNKLREFRNAQQYLKDIISFVYQLPALNCKLDSEAIGLFSSYELKKQEDALATSISAQAALHGKSAGKTLRFAGLMHVLEIVVNKLPGDSLVSAMTLQKAIDLVDRQDRWTLACHARIAGLSIEVLTSFQRRLHNIALKSRCPMSWTEIRLKMNSIEKHNLSVKDAEESMGKLVALGFGEVSRGPKGGLYYKALKSLPS